MRLNLLSLSRAAALLLVASAPARAQWVVYDPTNYVQAVQSYTQALQLYDFFFRQAQSLPVNLGGRYRTPGIAWDTHDLTVPHLPAVLAGLNTGNGVAASYRQSVDPLDIIDDVLLKTSPALKNRLTQRYNAIGLADSIAQLGIQQTGGVRDTGSAVMRVIQAMEDDAVSPANAYHTQIAVLDKINGASVLGLRIAEQGTQFLGHAVEQLVVDNLRKREAETQLMNAHIYQSRYGQRYGTDLFDKTAQRLDAWQQP